MASQNKYVSPSSQRAFTGYISVVVSENRTSQIHIQDIFTEEFCNAWSKATCKDANKNTHCISLHAKSAEIRHDHYHFLYWHYRNCAATDLLWKTAKENGFTFVWRPVGNLPAAIQYVLWGNGDKRIVLSRVHGIGYGTPGQSDNNPEDTGTDEQDWCEEGFVEREEPYDRRRERSRTPQSIRENRNGEEFDVPALSASQTKGLEKLMFIQKLVEKWGCSDYNKFQHIIAKKTSSHVQMIHSAFSLNKDYPQIVDNQINMCKIRDSVTPWNVMLEKYGDETYAMQSTEEYASREDSELFIAYWAQCQGISLEKFVGTVENIINRKIPKLNTFYLYGAVNAFKSKIINSIARGNVWTNTIVGLDKSNLRFAFANCINSRVIVIEECRACDETHDALKAIMGGDTSSTDVKYHPWQTIDRVPLLVSSNAPMWAGCSINYAKSFCEAVKARGFIHKCQAVPCGANFKFSIHPGAWKGLLDTPRGALESIYSSAVYGQFVDWLKDGTHERFQEWLLDENRSDPYLAANSGDESSDELIPPNIVYDNERTEFSTPSPSKRLHPGAFGTPTPSSNTLASRPPSGLDTIDELGNVLRGIERGVAEITNVSGAPDIGDGFNDADDSVFFNL